MFDIIRMRHIIYNSTDLSICEFTGHEDCYGSCKDVHEHFTRMTIIWKVNIIFYFVPETF